MKPYHYFWIILVFISACVYIDGFLVDVLSGLVISIVITYFVTPFILVLIAEDDINKIKVILKYFIAYWVIILPIMYINNRINNLYYYVKERILRILTRRE